MTQTDLPAASGPVAKLNFFLPAEYRIFTKAICEFMTSENVLM
jgi:hypothetical protein